MAGFVLFWLVAGMVEGVEAHEVFSSPPPFCEGSVRKHHVQLIHSFIGLTWEPKIRLEVCW
jgi:hypothetical protein